MRQSLLCQKEKKQSPLSRSPGREVGESQGEQERHLGESGGGSERGYGVGKDKLLK